jgi:hypothetical protein
MLDNSRVYELMVYKYGVPTGVFGGCNERRQSPCCVRDKIENLVFSGFWRAEGY